VYESITDLAAHRAPDHSLSGIIPAYVSLVVMPLLSRGKEVGGGKPNSSAMHADTRQTDFCAYQSEILLVGLLRNSLLGLW
jgi:hypothetical protein